MDINQIVRQYDLTEPDAVHKARAAAEYLFAEIHQEPVIPPAVLAKAAAVESPEDAAKVVSDARKALAGTGSNLEPLLRAASLAEKAAQGQAIPEYRTQILARLTSELSGLVTRLSRMTQESAGGHARDAQGKSDFLFAQEQVKVVRNLFNALMFGLGVAPLGVLDWHQGRPQDEPISWFAALTDLSADKSGFETAHKFHAGFVGQSVEMWFQFVTRARELGIEIKAAATPDEITEKVNAWHALSEEYYWHVGRKALFPKARTVTRPVSRARIERAVSAERAREEV